MSAGIVAEGLTKFFGDKDVVFDLDLSVERGTMFGFLGPNGAGKTTTVSMLCTLLRPTAGRAVVAGFDVATRPFEVRSRISVVFQDPTLDEDLSCVENLRFQCELFAVPRIKREAVIRDQLDLLGLSKQANVPAALLSGGMRRRLEIARGLLHRPEVLFLDEPTTGLDPQTRAAVWEHLRWLVAEQGTTILLTTHHLEEAEGCHDIAIIDHGRVVAGGSPDELRASIGADIVTLRTENDNEASRIIEREFAVATEASHDGIRVEIPDAGRFLSRIYQLGEIDISSVNVARPSLDDVFLRHTGRAIRDHEHANLTMDAIGSQHR